MSELRLKIEEKYKNALKIKDDNSVKTLRLIKSAIKDMYITNRYNMGYNMNQLLLNVMKILINAKYGILYWKGGILNLQGCILSLNYGILSLKF